MFSRDSSLTMEAGTREPLREVLQDRNKIHEESTGTKELLTSLCRFFHSLDKRIIGRENFDAIRRGQCGRTHKTNTTKMKSVFTTNMVNWDVRADKLQEIVGLL